MDLVGVNPARDIEQVCNVLWACPGRARSSESSIVQAREWPVPSGLWQSRRRSQVRITVGGRTKFGGRKELLSPARVLLFREREHGGDKPRGGFPVGANSCGTSRTVAPLRGVRRTTGFPPLPCLALKQELFLGALQEHLKASLLPKSEPFLNLRGHAQALGHCGQQELGAAFLQLSVVISPLSHAVPALCHHADHAQATAGGDVQNGAQRKSTNALREASREVNEGEIDSEARRGRGFGVSHDHVLATGRSTKRAHDDVTHSGGPGLAGLPWLACPRPFF